MIKDRPAPGVVCADDSHDGRRAIRVLVVDREELVQWGFRVLLDQQAWSQRCYAALDGARALDIAAQIQPHVVLVDVNMSDVEPEPFARELSRVSPRSRTLLLTGAEAMSASTVRAFGADGFVSRRWAARDLLATVRAAGSGAEIVLHSSESTLLSVRQQEILGLIADGATNVEIAHRLYLSRHTVKQHTSALYRKLNVRNRTHAVHAARRQGLIPA